MGTRFTIEMDSNEASLASPCRLTGFVVSGSAHEHVVDDYRRECQNVRSVGSLVGRGWLLVSGPVQVVKTQFDEGATGKVAEDGTIHRVGSPVWRWWLTCDTPY
jgi:hypothetical protein